MKIGYARVSTLEQNLDLQMDALKAAGCEKIITDEISGSVADRPGLKKLKEDLLRAGDTLVVWRLDRLGRSLKHLIEWVQDLKEAQIGFQSLQENIDTSTPTGELIFHFIGALAQFERNLIRERTKAGLNAARAGGKLGGRPKIVSGKKLEHALQLYALKKHSIKDISEITGVKKSSLYNYLNEQRRN